MNKIKPRIKPEMAFTESNQTLENRTNPNSKIRRTQLKFEARLKLKQKLNLKTSLNY